MKHMDLDKRRMGTTIKISNQRFC